MPKSPCVLREVTYVAYLPRQFEGSGDYSAILASGHAFDLFLNSLHELCHFTSNGMPWTDTIWSAMVICFSTVTFGMSSRIS